MTLYGTPDARPPAIFLMGPTASGKTALACALAESFPLGLVSVDSALVYRGLDIGTAKPDPATLARHPHALIDIRDPGAPYSAAMFREDALQAMAAMAANGAVPLLVGGTGLYFRALERGLSELPQADAGLRARIAEEARRHGWPALHARLAERDPDAAARIRPNDAQRLQRALEVIELTGRPLSEQQGRPRARFPYRLLKLALVPADRDLLRERIARRFDGMLAAGFLDEVRRLRARGDLDPELPALRAVGYRQAWQHLDGETGPREFRERAIFATNQLAKRQLTWLRSEVDARTLDPGRGDPFDTAAGAVALSLGGHAGQPRIRAFDRKMLCSTVRPQGCENRKQHTNYKRSRINRGIKAMSKGQSLQDPFLNALRREHVPVAIYLVNGIKLQGTIESFDQFVVLLRNQVSQMVYKHAISTVVPSRNVKISNGEAHAHGEESTPAPAEEST